MGFGTMQHTNDNELISTDVDNLITLVKQRKQISFDDAANALGVSILTIESWANFLEEEGILSIFYKFTTPYLAYDLAHSDTFIQNVSKMKDISSEIESAFSILDLNTKKEDYASAHKDLARIQKKVRDLVISAKKDKNIAKHLDHASLFERADSLEASINHAKSLLVKGDMPRVKVSFERLHDELLSIYQQIRDSITKVSAPKQEGPLTKPADVPPAAKAPGEEKKDTGTEEGKAEEPKPPLNPTLGEDYNTLIKEAYAALSNGDIDLVRKLYAKIESLYANLPSEFKDKREKINEALIKINDDLASHLSTQTSLDIEDASRKIEQMIPVVKKDISSHDYKSAQKHYKEIEDIYNSLPEGFIDKKIELENKILDLHAELIDDEKNKFTKDMDEGNKTITEEIRQIESYLAAKRLKDAVDVYNQIKKKYSELPLGFMHNKIEIQNRIYEVYRKILLLDEQLSDDELKTKSDTISSISQKIQESMDKGDIANAVKLLKEANDIFDTLPDDFFEEKLRIENSLIGFSRRLSQLEKEFAQRKFNTLNERIAKNLSQMQSYLAQKNHDLAQQVYKETLMMYNSLPPGFLEERNQIRKRISELYRKLVFDSDSDLMVDFTDAARQKYENLLMVIIATHESIEKREFDAIEPNYGQIVSIYNSLPIGFVQNKVSIRHEILKIYDEVQLYKRIKTLSQLFDSQKLSDIAEIKGMLGTVNMLYDEMYEECREDAELFEYVKQKYDYFVFVLMDKGLAKPGELKSINPMINEAQYTDAAYAGTTSEEPDTKDEDDGSNLPMETDLPEEEEETLERLKKMAHPKDDEDIPPPPKPIPEDNLYGRSPDEQDRIMAVHASQEIIRMITTGEYSEALKKADTKSGYIPDLLSILKDRSSSEKYAEQITVFLSAMNEVSRKGTIEGQLAQMKLIRGFVDYIHGNIRSSRIDLERVNRMYPFADSVRKMLSFVS